MMNSVICGDALEVLQSYEDNVFDAIVCDPPCGIAFMGKSWDSNKGGRDQWIAWLASIMREALRTLKPGGHCLVWALPRTSHWTATALEDAGFEIRDVVHHLFGSGFPKSLNVSKGIDRYFNAEREVVGEGKSGKTAIWDAKGTMGDYAITAPATDAARQWQGYGTALKPAAEHWILCRKPLSERSIAENVLKWGVGTLNIDACRVGTVADMNPCDFDDTRRTSPKFSGILNGGKEGQYCARTGAVPNGRFPAHLVLSHAPSCTDTQCIDGCPVLALDRQSGTRKSGGGLLRKAGKAKHSTVYGSFAGADYDDIREPSTGTASRYFAQFRPDNDVPPFYYASKASRRERNAGCETLPAQPGFDKNKSATIVHTDPDTGETTHSEYKPSSHHNHHPTVKPLSLIKYLCTLITPPNGVILDMFAGSGTTGVAAVQCGFRYVLIEQSQEYVEIARARIAHAEQEIAKKSTALVSNCS